MDYEMKYKEALERAKGIYKETWNGYILEIFPELAESEDERIRNQIINFIEEYGNPIHCEWQKDWIAWLEKQVDKDKLIKELGKYKVKYTQEVLSQQLEKQGEYSSTVGKYFITPEESLGTSADKINEVVNDCIFGEQGEKKWTEEDKKRLQSCISSLQGKGLMGGVDTINTKWLKSLKQRMEGKL